MVCVSAISACASHALHDVSPGVALIYLYPTRAFDHIPPKEVAGPLDRKALPPDVSARAVVHDRHCGKCTRVGSKGCKGMAAYLLRCGLDVRVIRRWCGCGVTGEAVDERLVHVHLSCRDLASIGFGVEVQ